LSHKSGSTYVPAGAGEAAFWLPLSGLYRREAWRAWSIALDVQKKETIPFIEITVETQGRPRRTSAMSAWVTQRASSLAPEPVVGEDS
jgi:hypothetical protein